jgi:lipopolysaccharide/colanic/teichoic acid biosynthesis glycosyltransferase
MRRQLVYLLPDWAWLAMAFLAASRLEHRLSPASQPEGWLQSMVPVGTALVIWTVARSWVVPDGHDRECRLAGTVARMAMAAAFTVGVLLVMALLSDQLYATRVLLWFGPLMIFGLVGIRWATKTLLRPGRPRRMVILGDGRVAEELARKIAADPEALWEVAGVLRRYHSYNAGGPPDRDETVTTLGVLDLLRREHVEAMVIALAEPLVTEVRNLLAACREQGLAVYFVPQPYQLYVSRAQLFEVDGVPLLSLDEINHRAAALMGKRIMDLLLGVPLGLLAAAPLWLAAAVLQRWTGEGFRRELRCGRDGRLFRMYRLNVDRDDPALRGFEKLLARSSLTELPQLWNVVRGEMALVGPRPESPERVRNYSDWQRQRLKMPPGITGLAQVHGLRERHSSDEKARFDLQYILHWSLLSDIALLIETAWALAARLRRPSARRLAPAALPAAEFAHVDRPQSRAR